MTPSSTRTVHIRIEGRVQGVAFRAWTEDAAIELGLDGWVRNRRDGTVEAVFSGPSEAVEDMLSRCRTGPPAARVSHVEIVGEEAWTEPGFQVRPTA
jgi:acylphosphatase